MQLVEIAADKLAEVPDNIRSLIAAVQMLDAIELCASACYDNTQAHIANVKTIEKYRVLKSYDYRTGYPENLDSKDNL